MQLQSLNTEPCTLALAIRFARRYLTSENVVKKQATEPGKPADRHVQNKNGQRAN